MSLRFLTKLWLTGREVLSYLSYHSWRTSNSTTSNRPQLLGRKRKAVPSTDESFEIDGNLTGPVKEPNFVYGIDPGEELPTFALGKALALEPVKSTTSNTMDEQDALQNGGWSKWVDSGSEGLRPQSLEPEVKPEDREYEGPVDVKRQDHIASGYHPVTGSSQAFTYDFHSLMSLDDVATEPLCYGIAETDGSTCFNQILALSEPHPSLAIMSPRLSHFDWWALYGEWFTDEPKMDGWDTASSFLKPYTSTFNEFMSLTDTYEEDMTHIEKSRQHQVPLVAAGFDKTSLIMQDSPIDDPWWIEWTILVLRKRLAMTKFRSSIDYSWCVAEIEAYCTKDMLKVTRISRRNSGPFFTLDCITPNASLRQRNFIYYPPF